MPQECPTTMGCSIPRRASALATSAACATAARALAMAKPRPVEGNGAVLPGGMIDHAADQHVIDHRAVAVKKHDRRAAPAHEIVKPHAVSGDERSFWRMLALGFSGAAVHEDGGPGQGKSRHAEDAALALCRAGAWQVCSEGVFHRHVRSSFALPACANEATLAPGPYFFQSAPSTNPRTATPASVAIGCSLSDFSTKGFTCLTASCACSPYSRA